MDGNMQTSPSWLPGLPRGLRWSVWGLYVALWSLALLTPYPADVNQAVLPATWREPAAKALHVGAYALLAILSAWLRVPWRQRWLLLAFLSFHAAGTEFGQLFVPRRHASLRDVGFDHIGIVWGVIVTFGWWMTRPPEEHDVLVHAPKAEFQGMAKTRPPASSDVNRR